MTDNNNMRYWEKLTETPEASLKDGKVSGVDIKTINPEYFQRKATDFWGPFGKGWGYDLISTDYKEGRPVFSGNGNLLFREEMVLITIKLWYMDGGEKVVCPPQFGNKPFLQQTHYGPKTDFEAPKKALTDAIKKSLSFLGFGSDVYAGEWDDVTPEELEAKKAEARTEKREEKQTEGLKTFLIEFEEAIKETLPGLRTKREVATFRTKWTRKANKMPQPTGFIRRINDECDNRVTAIEESKTNSEE